MLYDFSRLKRKSKEIEEWLLRELSALRTGRASPTVLDGVMVETYGSRLAIKELGAISVLDARTVRIVPWDQSQTKEIEKAVVLSNLGLSVAVDDQGLRVSSPELSNERRQGLVRVAKEKLEHGRVSLRALRDEVWREIQKKEKDGEIGEDEKFRLKKEMEKIIEETNKRFEEAFGRKEREILEK